MYAAVGAAVLISTVRLLRLYVKEVVAIRTGTVFAGRRETSASETTTTERWLIEQRMRTKRVEEVCKRYEDMMVHTDVEKLSESDLKYLEGIAVSDRYKAVFNPIPKVATCSWISLLLRMSGDFENKTLPKSLHGSLKKHGWSPLTDKNISDIVHILKTYTKFLVVRHPYSRLHSAFTNKFQDFPYGTPDHMAIYPRVYGSRVVKQYWENPTPESLETGMNISFQDFIRFVGDPRFSPSYKFDAHWMPYNLRTSPCVVRFDYILKLETIAEDSEQFLGNVLNTTYRLPQMHVGNRTNLTAYENISTPIMERLWETYHLDFELFGYEWPD